MKQAQIMFALAMAGLVGCSFHARAPNDYRDATRETLEAKNGDIQACYENELKANEADGGKVVVHFEVEAKTGNFVNVKVLDKKSTASAGLKKCVVDALQGLKLDPPDQRTGEATFEWEFARAAS